MFTKSNEHYLKYFISALANLPFYLREDPNARENCKRVDIESKIDEVADSLLPCGALGFWDPVKGSGAIGKDLPGHYKEFVRQHEIAHALGADGSPEGEYKADVYAAMKTGRFDLIRGLFYRPPISE